MSLASVLRRPSALILGAMVLSAGGAGASGEEWTVLFDGTSTAAWRAYGGDAFPKSGWVVEKGLLKAVAGADRTDIVTREKYGDFELELDWRVTPGGNSGVFYRVAEGPEAVWHSGPEMQILDDERHKDGKDEKTSAGSLYALMAPKGKKLRPVGEFNSSRVVARGNHVEHWLNGTKVVEYELGSDALKALIAASKFKDMPRFAKEREGHVALQHHGDDVFFRNVRIRRLSSR
jgi:hypothetical protein